MQAGILTSVTYPTGGRTEFSYEAHRYIDDHGTSHMAGGLRIRQIRDVESNGNVLYRNFRYSTYADHINGGGVLNVVPAASSYPYDTNEVYYRETMMRMAFFIMLVLYSWLYFVALMVNWLQDTNYFNITNAVKENNYDLVRGLSSQTMRNTRP